MTVVALVKGSLAFELPKEPRCSYRLETINALYMKGKGTVYVFQLLI